MNDRLWDFAFKKASAEAASESESDSDSDSEPESPAERPQAQTAQVLERAKEIIKSSSEQRISELTRRARSLREADAAQAPPSCFLDTPSPLGNWMRQRK